MKTNEVISEQVKLISPDEAARRLGLNAVCPNPKGAILRMARRGDLRAVRVSKYTLITAASVEEFLRRVS